MIWFGKSFIKFCKIFINLIIKLVSTQTCSLARVRLHAATLRTAAAQLLPLRDCQRDSDTRP